MATTAFSSPSYAWPMVFTDLDGTLLDHHDYSFSAALATLEKLKTHQIPVIATTSKTVQEVIHLYEAMAINGPFIVETVRRFISLSSCFPSNQKAVNYNQTSG